MPVVVSVAQGGTGANTSSAALTALGAAPVAAYAQANTARNQANNAYTAANNATGGFSKVFLLGI